MSDVTPGHAASWSARRHPGDVPRARTAPPTVGAIRRPTRTTARSGRKRCSYARWPTACGRRGPTGNRSCCGSAGPGVVHTGGGTSDGGAHRAGFVDVLFAGNALATHRHRVALYGTSLGVDVSCARATSTVTSTTSGPSTPSARPDRSRQPCDAGVLTSGIMHALVTHEKRYVLVGSVRDDGPLPDVHTDIIEGQRAMRAEIKRRRLLPDGRDQLYSVATGNILPASVPLVCVDINPSTVTQLADRGSGPGPRHRHRRRTVPRAARPRAGADYRRGRRDQLRRAPIMPGLRAQLGRDQVGDPRCCGAHQRPPQRCTRRGRAAGHRRPTRRRR